MSQPRGFGLNGRGFYTNVCQPCDVNLNFVVNSTNTNQLGVSSVKSNGYVNKVYMNTSAGAPVGTPNFGTARTYGILAATAITNTGNTVVTGNIGQFPGSTVTGFPSGTFTGVENLANAAASSAKASAQASYTSLQALTPTTIATALDGQTLVPGTYKAASGTFTLAASAGGTLTLNGLGVYVLQTTTTLVTGAGGTPVITLAGGARAQDVYWVVGSSATINSGFTGTFVGNVIANTSITDTLGGTVNGSLVALNGAVTLSAATAINTQALSPTVTSGNPNPLPGYAWIQLNNNFNYYLGGFAGYVSPLSGTDVAINSTVLTLGQAYVITTLGTSTLADWVAIGLPAGLTPTVGQSFIAIKTGNGAGTGKVQVPLVSAVNSVEVIGTPNTSIANASISANGGAWLLVQFLSNSVLTAPVDGSVVSMTMKFDASSVTIDGL